MELDQAMQIVKDNPQGVLVTHRRDGRAQLSNIIHVLGDDGVIRISITDDRAKTKNLRRDPRCELYVGRSTDFWAYLVIDAQCELSPVAASPDDATVEELVEQYRGMRGEHPDWDEFRQTMVNDKRLVARLTPQRAYGMWADA
jgi:PPOX class probable F420-dependent enzyme